MSEKKSFNEIIHSGKPVLVDFFAEWCGPCKMMKPILEELKSKMGDEAFIIKIDVDKNQAMASAHNVRGVPTLAVFKDGKVAWKKSGVMGADQLETLLRQYI